MNKVPQDFICFEHDSFENVLKKINSNKSGIIFVLDGEYNLIGCLTDGDIRRRILHDNNIDLKSEIGVSYNEKVKFVFLNEISELSDDVYKNGVDVVPIVSVSKKILGLKFKNDDKIFVEDFELAQDSKAFIIAEIGNNHQGDFQVAKKLVEAAADAGANCAKFQLRQLDAVYGANELCSKAKDLGAEYTIDLLNKFQLTNEEMIEIFEYVRQKGLIPLCTPWDHESLEILEAYGMGAYKVASADFTNYPLLESIASTGKLMICSTGMSTDEEVKQTIAKLRNMNASFALLHCNSTYPSPDKDVNLLYLLKLRELSGSFVGYSGHERGHHIPVAAVALGAKIIEKHITLDRSQEGNDHKVSLLPAEFKKMVANIRSTEVALGTQSLGRELTQGELINRENLAKSLFATTNLKKGERITREVVGVKSPGIGLQPNRIDDLIGKIANRDISLGEFFYESDASKRVEKRHYKFGCRFGVSVRYHDYSSLIQDTNLDFVEFHLSYNDLVLNPEKFIDKNKTMGFAVHCPELFKNDHLLDLASDDPYYRKKSISNLDKTIAVVQSLRNYFPSESKPVLVVNAGGWSTNGFVSDGKNAKYNLIAEVLNERIDQNIIFAIQTMPPFPWHFGGQSYHNLFVAPEEIKNFCCENANLKICLDVSHSMMACNYYGWDLTAYLDTVCPYVVHSHVVDAKGSDGEGVRVGDGDVDFRMVFRKLKSLALNAQFIPEVWQGHIDKGAGFWSALNYLERHAFNNND